MVRFSALCSSIMHLVNRQSTRSLLRVALGVTLAFVLYHLATNFASTDCGSIQSQLREGGPRMLGRVLLTGTIAAAIGMPASLIAVTAGVVTGPFIGAPLTSISVALASLALWGLGRLLNRRNRLPGSLDRLLENSAWFQSMMDKRPESGFHWTAVQGLVAPVPYPYFGFIAGAKVPHLNAQSFLTGVFASSIIHSAGYSLAGASIGCAVVNQAVGFSIDAYRHLIIVSCLILILLSKIQSTITEKNAA
jgi:uncharacterized membrane protein YdjX (TVP38/TMEM64 family)